MNVNVVMTHHIFQKNNHVYHPLIQKVLGGWDWIEQPINKLHLASNLELARAADTPLHLSNHPWIHNQQWARMDDFYSWKFEGYSAWELVEGPNAAALKDTSAYRAMRSALDQYAADIRDVTAKAIYERSLPLTTVDPHFPGMTTETAERIAKELLSKERFGQGAAAALARDEYLRGFRAYRQGFVDLGLDPGWLMFDTPQKAYDYIANAEMLIGASPTNRYEATAESLEKWIEHIDDGRVTGWVDDKIGEMKLTRHLGKASLATKLGAIGLVAGIAMDLNAAAAAPTVEASNEILAESAGYLTLEFLGEASGLRFLGSAGIALFIGLAAEYLGNPSFKSVADKLGRFVAQAVPQVVERVSDVDRLFVGGEDYLQLQPKPGAPQVPHISGFKPVSLPRPGGGSTFDFRNYVTALQQDGAQFSIDENWVKLNRNGVQFSALIVRKGLQPIAFIVNEEGVPDYIDASGGVTMMAKGTMVMIVAELNVDGDFKWMPVASRTDVVVDSGNITKLGPAILNSMKLAAMLKGRNFTEGETRTVSRGDTMVSTTLITEGPSHFWVVRVNKNAYASDVKSRAVVEDIYIFDDTPGSGAFEAQRSYNTPDGPVTLGLKRDAAGNVTHTFNGTVIVEGDPRFDAAMYQNMAEGELMARQEARSKEGVVSTELATSAPRDLATAIVQVDGPMTVYIRDILGEHSGHLVLDVSTRLVGHRLLSKHLEEGRTFNEQEYKARVQQDAAVLAQQINAVGSVGGIFGSALGRALADGDAVADVLLSGILGSLARSAGQAIAVGILADSLAQGYQTGLAELPGNLKGAAAGAVSSFITAELIEAIGLEGNAGELAGAALGSVIGQIVPQLVAARGAEAVRAALRSVDAMSVWTAVASYVGTELASRVIAFDTTGGQLGAQLGASVGGVTGAALAVKWGSVGSVWGPVGALAGAFLGYIVGGLIGSVFSGAPRSGAAAQWDESRHAFVAGDAWAFGGGSPEGGRALATAAAETFNALLAATGGSLLEPENVNAGHYGMRKRHYVYRSSFDPGTDLVEFRGSDGAEKLIGYGVGQALLDPDFQVAGGDVYVKRALYASAARFAEAGEPLDLKSLLADLAIARDWSFYRNNPGGVEAISKGLEGSDRESYLGGWLVTAARAADLGLDRRHASDWHGGFEFLLRQAGATAASVEFRLNGDLSSGQYARSMQVGIFGVTDSVDIARQTLIEKGPADDVVDLRRGIVQDQRGLSVNGHKNDDIAVAGEDYAPLSDHRLIVAAGSSRGQAELTIAPNAAGELVETFRLGLTDAAGLSLHGPDSTVTVVGESALPFLQVGRSFASEADEYAVFRVSLSRAAASAITVQLSLAGDEAGRDQDWLPSIEVSASSEGGWSPSSSLTLSAGETEYFVRVPIVRDNVAGQAGTSDGREPNESFTLGARASQGQEALSNGALLVTGTGTIVDGESAKPLVWMDDAIVHAGRPAAMAFGLSRPPVSDGEVTLSTSDRRQLSIEIAATVDAGAGNDLVYASNFGDNIFGGAGRDTLHGGRLDDWLFGDDGDDLLNAGSVGPNSLGGDGNYLDGGKGDDRLIGREGSDWLEGGEGVDVIEGGAGGDVLAGGAGRGDVMRGGRGNDQYVFRIGDVSSADIAHADVVHDESGLSLADIVAQAYKGLPAAHIAEFQEQARTGELFRSGRGLDNWAGRGVQVTPDGTIAGGDDTLALGPGITLEDIKIRKSQDGKDLVVEHWPEGVFKGDHIVLKDWFSPFGKIERLAFEDGNELLLSDFDTIILGSDGAETIIGTDAADFVHGGGGNDLIALLGGNDVGNGGLGNDTLSGGDGFDAVVGADGDDTLFGGRETDFLSGGRGDDSLSGDRGNDVLAGGAGADELVGGIGDDVFKFNRGDGRDTFLDALSDEWQLVWASGPGWQGGYEVKPDGSIGHPVEGPLYDGQRWVARIWYDEDTGKLWRHAPASAAASSGDSGEDVIEFGVGIDINDLRFVRGDGGRDIIVGIEAWKGRSATFASLTDQIRLQGWGPSGSLSARGSIETFSFINVGAVEVSATVLDGGGDGDDDLVGIAASKNWITGGTGDDRIVGGSLDDILNGNAGRDRLLGEGGSDTLLGGAGDDVLIGDRSDDPVRIEAIPEDEPAEISLDEPVSAGAAGDLLVGGEGFDTASYETATAGVHASLGAPRLADDLAAGDAAGDRFSSIEALRGSAFGDTLEGDGADNVLEGGRGDDMLRGALGDDTYLFGRGDGRDSIDDRFAPSRMVVVDSAGRLQAPFTADLELIAFDGEGYHFDHIVTNAETGDIIYRKSLAPTSDRDLRPPSSYDAQAWVRDPDGGEIYTINGREVVEELPEGSGGDDVLLLKDDAGLPGYSEERTIGLSDLLFAFDTGENFNDLLITLKDSPADQIRIKGFRAGAVVAGERAVETIEFADGTTVSLAGLRFDSSGALLSVSGDTAAEPKDALIVGTDGGNVLVGGFGNDGLSGHNGADTLEGGSGDDQLSGGMGADLLRGGSGSDTATYLGSDDRGGIAIDLARRTSSGGEAQGDALESVENIVGSQFDDLLTGDSGNNVLKGNRGRDTLTGALGADVLLGDGGDDLLAGNEHDDNLEGGDGHDVLDGGGDRDLLAGGEGNDILRGDGVSGDAAGANLVSNPGFEDSGAVADDLPQPYGLSTTDLPGWKSAATRPLQLVTSAWGVTPLEGQKAVHLDDGTGNVEISQAIAGLSAGESLQLAFGSAAAGGATSGGFEVLWNGNVVLTVTNGTTAMTPRAKSLLAIAGVNQLTFRGTGAVDGVGALIDHVRLTRLSGASDQLSGGAGIDRLEGGAGNDTLLGGEGDDSGSQLVDAATAGGLFGGAGNDILDGGAGNDSLDGGAGADQFLFRAGSGDDTVVVGGGGADELIFDELKWDGLWLSRPQGSADLLVTAVGSGASARVAGWFSSPASQARRIVAGDRMLSRFDVEALLAAMTAESPTVPASWPSPPSENLSKAMAAAWQLGAAYVDRAIVVGTPGNDMLAPEPYWAGGVRYDALAGDDSVAAGSGADIITGGGGKDSLAGGAGDDEIRFGADPGFDSVDGQLGVDSIVATANSARINLSHLAGVERISGEGYSDVQIFAGSGMSLDLSGVAMENVFQVNGAGGGEMIVGSSAADRIFGGGGRDALSGGAGDDWIQGGEGDDTLVGGIGADTLDQSFSIAAQRIDLAAGMVTSADFTDVATEFESAIGGAGDDLIIGTTASNLLDGGGGNDTIEAGDGRDTLIGGAGADFLKGGLSSDTASYATQLHASTATVAIEGVEIDGVIVDLGSNSSLDGPGLPEESRARQGDAEGDGYFGIENLEGSRFNDSLAGDGGDNELTGGAGNDVLRGGAGTDVAVFGGKRSDYQISTIGGLVVRDMKAEDGNEGVDKLFDMELLRFADMTVAVGVAASAPPQIGPTPLADQIWLDGVRGIYQIPAGAFVDPNQDFLTFSATLLSGQPLPEWLSFDRSTGIFSGTAGLDLVGVTFQIEVKAADANYTVSDVFLITIAEAPGPDIVGTSRRDILEGTFRSERMIGLAGPDVFLGSGGADRLDGGADVDTADYSLSRFGVTADLRSGKGTGGDADGDEFVSIERVTGSDRDDALYGSADANLLLGGDGDDLIDGGGGDDLLEGGLGLDTLRGGSGNDRINARVESDGSLDDFIDGGVGSDTLGLIASAYGVTIDLNGANGNPLSIEHVIGTSHSDRITGSESDNELSGEYGDDDLSGENGRDRLSGGVGNDTLQGGGGDDLLEGGVGDDRLQGGGGTNVIRGGEGIDTADYRVAGAGLIIDLATGSAGLDGSTRDNFANADIENVDASDHRDIVLGSAGANLLRGFGGDDEISGGLGDDRVEGGEGKDSLAGGGGGDTLVGGAGDDSLSGGAGTDTIDGGSGDDVIHLERFGEDAVSGGEGSDTASFAGVSEVLAVDLAASAVHKLSNIENLVGGLNNDSLSGSAAANRLDGGGGHDSLKGRDGDDSLAGRSGDDTLEGGAGADSLDGGEGVDVAVYASSSAGAGFASGPVGGASSSGVAALTRTLEGVDVDLAAGTGANSQAAGDSLAGIEILVGSAFSDRLRGSADSNILAGGAGEDLLYGGAGDDTLWGQGEDDILYGEGGNDTLQAGAGADRLFGGAGNDVLVGADGNDILGDDGGTGEDRLDGGAGDDLMLGSSDADTYDGGTGTDTLDFGGSAAGVQVNLSAVAVNALLANRGAGGDAEGDTYAAGTIENVTGSEFEDVLSSGAAANVLRGRGGSDRLSGGAGDDALRGDSGNDILHGDEGADSLDGGVGDDTLDGGGDSDTLIGGDGEDALSGGEGVDRLLGGSGGDILAGGAGADSIDGGAGDDTIILTADAEDTVEGGDGVDTASFAGLTAGVTVDLANAAADKLTGVENLVGGSGADTLLGSSSANRLEGGAGNDAFDGRGGADEFVGGEGVDWVGYSSSAAGGIFSSGPVGAASVAGAPVVAAVSRSLTGVDLDLAAGRAANADAEGDSFSGIENVAGSGFGDRLRGSSGSNVLMGLGGDDVIFGDAGDDTLSGDSGNDILYGDAGVDSLRGGEGDDRLFGGGETDFLYGGEGKDVLDAGDAGDHLDGGAGDDILIGGLGEDGYHAGRATGADVIHNFDTDGSTDSVVYASDVQNTDLWFSKVAGTRDLLVKVLGTSSSVTVKDWFATSASGDFTRGSDDFAVDMMVAGAWLANKKVNVPQLIAIMAGQPEPASFSALSGSLQDQIRQTWINNTPPTIVAAPDNPVALAEDGTVYLRFTVNDRNQTPDASITVTAVSGGVLQAIQPGDITVVDSSTRQVAVRALPNVHGAGSVTVTASDGYFSSSPLVVSLPVFAVADVPSLGLKPLSGNAGSTIEVDGTLDGGVIALLRDSDEVFSSITLEGIPVGATLRSGSNSFTAVAGSTTATITSWELSTLQLVLPPGSTADFSLTVRASSREPSTGRASAEAVGTISVTVNGTPTGVSFAYSLPQIAENMSNPSGLVVGTLTAVDPGDSTGSYAFAVVGAETARFMAVGNQLWLRPGVSLDHESGPVSVGIRITDNSTGTPLTFDGFVSVRPGNVNEAPWGLGDVDPAVDEVAEGAAAGTLVGVKMKAADPEGASLTYRIASDPKGWFAIDSATGIVSVRAGAVIDYEATESGTASINVEASDGANTAHIINFAISIADRNEAPYFTSAATLTLGETTPVGSVVASLSAIDPDKDMLAHGEWGLVYSIVGGTGSSLFELDGSKLKTKGVFDYESGVRSYTLTLRVRDTHNTGLYSEQNFVVSIDNVNERPTPLTDANTASNRVIEGAEAGTGTGITLSSQDPEGVLTYSITNDPFNWFAVNSTTGEITVRSGAVIDYEMTSNGTVSINVQASDGVTAPATLTNLLISISDKNELPVFTSLPSANLAETAGEGALVSIISAADPDKDSVLFGEAGHIYSVIGGTGATLFEMVGKELRTKAGATFDFETGPRSYSLTLRVRDNNNTGLFADQNFTVNILDVPEGPSIPAAIAEADVNEGAGFERKISGSVDPSGGDVDYYLTRNPAGLFEIQNPSGMSNEATLRLVAPIDFETIGGNPDFVRESANRGYVDVRLVGRNAAGINSAERIVRVHFNNVNDQAPSEPTMGWVTTETYTENGSVLNATIAWLNPLQDGDGTLNPLGYEITSNPGGMFEITATGQLRFKVASFDYEALQLTGTQGEVRIGIRATDGTHVSSTMNVAVFLRNVNEFSPVYDGLGGATIAENLLFGSVVTTVRATDRDAQGAYGNVTAYRIVGGNSNGGNDNSFSIDNAGQIKINNGVDYERLGANKYYDLQVIATDGGGRDSDVFTVRIDITNQAERLVIYDGRAALPVMGRTTEGFASGYGYGAHISGAPGFEDQWRRIWQDTNGNRVFGDTVGGVADVVLARFDDEADPQNWVKSGFRWSGAAWTSEFLQELPPIVLDLDGCGSFASNVSVRFDVDGDGRKDQVGWIGGRQAFLVLDRNGNGLIDSGAEISFAQDLPGASTDLEGLRAYDSNGDGLLDARDSRFGEFQIWQDSDEDGETDAGELRSLASADVVSIGLTIDKPASPQSHTAGQAILGTSVFRRGDGRSGLVGDVALRWDYLSLPGSEAAQAGGAAAAGIPRQMQAALDAVPEGWAAGGVEGAFGPQPGGTPASPVSSRHWRMVQAMAAFGGQGAADMSLREPGRPAPISLHAIS